MATNHSSHVIVNMTFPVMDEVIWGKLKISEGTNKIIRKKISSEKISVFLSKIHFTEAESLSFTRWSHLLIAFVFIVTTSDF